MVNGKSTENETFNPKIKGMENPVDTKVAKTTLGRKAAEYTTKIKLGETVEFVDSLKASDARQFGYETVEQYQTELDSLAPKTAGKRELDQSFQVEFNVLSARHETAIADVDAEPETYKENVLASRTALIVLADSFPHPLEGSKRTDFRRMRISSVGGGKITNYFGGWVDGSQHLRNQYGNGRLVADASSNLDGDAITADMEKVMKASSPYNNGQLVPAGKSSGYEIEQPTDESPASDPQNPEDAESLIPDPDTQDNPPKAELTHCEKCGGNHMMGSGKWVKHNPS